MPTASPEEPFPEMISSDVPYLWGASPESKKLGPGSQPKRRPAARIDAESNARQADMVAKQVVD
jgi:hypothetical protein